MRKTRILTGEEHLWDVLTENVSIISERAKLTMQNLWARPYIDWLNSHISSTEPKIRRKILADYSSSENQKHRGALAEIVYAGLWGSLKLPFEIQPVFRLSAGQCRKPDFRFSGAIADITTAQQAWPGGIPEMTVEELRSSHPRQAVEISAWRGLVSRIQSKAKRYRPIWDELRIPLVVGIFLDDFESDLQFGGFETCRALYGHLGVNFATHEWTWKPSEGSGLFADPANSHLAAVVVCSERPTRLVTCDFNLSDLDLDNREQAMKLLSTVREVGVRVSYWVAAYINPNAVWLNKRDSLFKTSSLPVSYVKRDGRLKSLEAKDCLRCDIYLPNFSSVSGRSRLAASSSSIGEHRRRSGQRSMTEPERKTSGEMRR